jgi:mevalonate pyrophosphate decarboxylase
MPILTSKAPKKAKKKRMKEEMDKFSKSELHSGSKKGPIVKDRAQAIAIGLAESDQSSRKAKKKRK